MMWSLARVLQGLFTVVILFTYISTLLQNSVRAVTPSSTFYLVSNTPFLHIGVWHKRKRRYVKSFVKQKREYNKPMKRRRENPTSRVASSSSGKFSCGCCSKKSNQLDFFEYLLTLLLLGMFLLQAAQTGMTAMVSVTNNNNNANTNTNTNTGAG